MSIPPFDDQFGNVTLISSAAVVGYYIVRFVIAIAEWLDGSRRYPWRR